MAHDLQCSHSGGEKDRSLEKSHANDAYAMGRLHPGHRSSFQHFKKLRRNNRILEKFYDAKYIDCRDRIKKKGSELSCGRTNRSEPRQSDKNQRIYRSLKVSRGRRSVRRKHYDIRPYDRVVCNGNVFTAKGMHCRGARIMLGSGKSVPKKSRFIFQICRRICTHFRLKGLYIKEVTCRDFLHE